MSIFTPVLDAVARHDTVILHRHSNPDGDALGSQLGLKSILADSFPGKRVYAVGDGAGRYAFMEGSQMDAVPDGAYDGALAIVLDTSAERLISDERWKRAATTARIDHHLFTEALTNAEAIDSTYESCCGMIADMARTHALCVSAAAAKSLYTGMVTDTGRFRYDCVSARTFELAAFLRARDFSTEDIYHQLYANDLDQLLLRARFTQKIRLTKKNVAYIITTLSEAESSGAGAFTLSRGMVGLMADIRGVDIWANFTQTPQGVLCELRSSKYNISPVAVKYGGGGHAKASGATLQGLAQIDEMLADLDSLTEDA